MRTKLCIMDVFFPKELLKYYSQPHLTYTSLTWKTLVPHFNYSNLNDTSLSWIIHTVCVLSCKPFYLIRCSSYKGIGRKVIIKPL